MCYTCTQESCIFCKIARGQERNEILYEVGVYICSSSEKTLEQGLLCFVEINVTCFCCLLGLLKRATDGLHRTRISWHSGTYILQPLSIY